MAVDFKNSLVGRVVVYRDPYTLGPEQGVVSSVNAEAGIVFVRYGGGAASQATKADERLTLLNGERVVLDTMTTATAPGADGRRVSDDELADYVSNIGVGGYTQTEGRQFILDLCDARSAIAELRGEVERLMADLDTERTAREKTQQKFALLQAAMSDENWRELTSENDQLSKALSAANARIRELEAQRGGSAEAALRSIVHKLSNINDCVEDEGDRVYLGSTNDRERLQECADAVWLWWLANLTDEAVDPTPARAEDRS